MNQDSLRVPCIVDPTRIARIDGASAILMNWEVFFFCDEEARGRFVRDPLRWCGALTDPVTLQRFVPEDASPRLRHTERVYYFASVDSREAFASDPARYATVPHFMLGETRQDVEERERRRREKAREEAESGR